MVLSPLEWALEYIGRGWPVLPLYPVVNGKCACPDGVYKVGPDPTKWRCSPGKHPYANLHRGLKDATLKIDQVKLWWGRLWPDAGIGISLIGAKLLDIAPDGVVDLADFIARGLPETLTFRSGGGEGHQHFLYRLPDGAPQARLCLPTRYDIMSDGYCVAPPTLHWSGGQYTWLEYDSVTEPAEPPLWALELLLDQLNGRTSAATISVPGDAILSTNGEPPLEIDLDVWDGLSHAQDRSAGLWAIAGELAQAGANEATIIEALRERDQTLGWHKYANRADADKQYLQIARRQLANVMPRIHLNGSLPNAMPQTSTVTTEPWPEPLEKAAFYGPLGEFVLDVARQSEADPAALLGMTLCAVSVLLDPRSGSYAGHAWHPARVWCVLVGPTGRARKGTAGKIAEAIVRAADPDFGKTHVQEGLSTGEGLIWKIHDEIQKWDARSKPPGWVTSEPGIDDKRLLVIESEFASPLRVQQRDGNTLSPIVRRAWDLSSYGVLEMMTKTSPGRATGAHVVIAGHVTREELLKYVERTELVNGFANRFLWMAARRHQELPFGEEVDAQLIGNFASVVAQAVTWSEAGHRMGWAPETRQDWQQAYHELGQGFGGMFGAVTARAEPQVLRIAQVFAALDRTNMLRPHHLEAALAVWRYVERSCRWIFGEVLGDQHADDILLGLKTQGEMTRTDLRAWLGKSVSSASLTRALEVLASAGLTKVEMRTNGGRPAEVWSLV